MGDRDVSDVCCMKMRAWRMNLEVMANHVCLMRDVRGDCIRIRT